MPKRSPAKEHRIIAVREDRCLDYTPQKVELPVKESTVIQIGKGEHKVDLQMATVGKIGLLRLGIQVEAVVVNVFNPNYISFSLPVSWTGDYFVNGEKVNKSSIYMSGEQDSFHVRSKTRDTIGVTIPRQVYIDTIATLRGICQEEISLTGRELYLGEQEGLEVRNRLGAIINEACQAGGQRSAREISEDVFGILTDAYLHAAPSTERCRSRVLQAERIVRLAEECFMAADNRSVSLADLCASAGVSKSNLYSAFNQICGLPPLAYFHKRRLMKARRRLIHGEYERGFIKQAALSTGFRELGRFSVEYRKLFGESPSVTLSRS